MQKFHILGQEEIKPHKVRYYLENRDAKFEQKMAEHAKWLSGTAAQPVLTRRLVNISLEGKFRTLFREATVDLILTLERTRKPLGITRFVSTF